MNLFGCSSRTRMKILRRLNLSCFICDWDLAICDIHHIKPRKHGGSDSHENLTYLCPNCHRLADLGIINNFPTIEEIVGNKWLEVYAQSNVSENFKKYSKKGNLKSIETRRRRAIQKYNILIQQIKTSNIDFGKRGWIQKVSDDFNIPRQHVPKILRKYDTEFYNSCFHT